YRPMARPAGALAATCGAACGAPAGHRPGLPAAGAGQRATAFDRGRAPRRQPAPPGHQQRAVATACVGTGRRRSALVVPQRPAIGRNPGPGQPAGALPTGRPGRNQRAG
ncbi:hypothetical protein BC89_16560, partial [Pseudomonas monteilii]